MAIQQSVGGKMRELALFAGMGGGILGGKLLGWRTVCAVENNAYAASILVARQNDGILEPFPIWNDVRTFNGRKWKGRVDVVSGGFPCQDVSAAGSGAGLDGERSGLWKEMARIIGEVRPRFAFVENSPRLTGRGLDRVLGDLSSMGFNAKWGVVSAADAIWAQGDPCVYHDRERIWIVAESTDSKLHRVSVERGTKTAGANGRRGRVRVDGESGLPIKEGSMEESSNSNGQHGRAWRARRFTGADSRIRIPEKPVCLSSESSDADRTGSQIGNECGSWQSLTAAEFGDWWAVEPALGRVADGVADRVERIRGTGNGQVPTVAALAWRLLTELE